MIYHRSLNQLTRDYVLQILEHCEYNRESAAKILDLPLDDLKALLKKYTFFKPLAMLRYDPVSLPIEKQIIYQEKIIEKIIELPGPIRYIRVDAQEGKEENDIVTEYANLLYEYKDLKNKYNEILNSNQEPKA